MAYNLYRSLMQRDVIRPYVENAFKSLDNWPSPEQLHIEHPGKHDSNEDSMFHPSIHGAACALACYLTLHPVERKLLLPERKSFKDIMTPLMGSVTHTIVQQKLINDKLVKPEDVEVALVNEEHNWRGHVDLFFRGTLVDIKTVRAEKFKYLNQAKAELKWPFQLNPYMDEMGLETSIVLAIETGWPYEMKEFRIDKNPYLLEDIYSKWEYVSECIEKDTPPSHAGCEDIYCLARERFDHDRTTSIKI